MEQEENHRLDLSTLIDTQCLLEKNAPFLYLASMHSMSAVGIRHRTLPTLHTKIESNKTLIDQSELSKGDYCYGILFPIPVSSCFLELKVKYQKKIMLDSFENTERNFVLLDTQNMSSIHISAITFDPPLPILNIFELKLKVEISLNFNPIFMELEDLWQRFIPQYDVATINNRLVFPIQKTLRDINYPFSTVINSKVSITTMDRQNIQFGIAYYKLLDLLDCYRLGHYVEKSPEIVVEK
jgi:hypothetical protein